MSPVTIGSSPLKQEALVFGKAGKRKELPQAGESPHAAISFYNSDKSLWETQPQVA